MKKFLSALVIAGLLALGPIGAIAAQHSATAPKTLIHVVTVSWKDGTTPEQIQAALEGAHRLPSQFKGITRVWTKTVKAQGERTHAIVMEFTGEQALQEYAGSDAQKEWYKSYIPIRRASTTFDITN
jgi:hypothetical protein